MNNEYPLKKVAFFILFLIALFAIPLTVYLVQRQQETRSRATQVSEDSVAVVIDGQQYTKADVRKIAEEQNDPTVVDSQALKDALGVLEERKILDKAAADLGIQIDSAKVEAFKRDDYSENEAHYEVLKNQVILSAVKSRETLSIEFWNPPASGLADLTAQEKSDAGKQLSDGVPALIEAENRLKAGEDIINIGNSLLTKYPSLKDVLAVNGNILDSLSSDEKLVAQQPVVYEFGDSSLDETTLNALFAMNVDEVKRVTNTESNKGGTVLKLVSKGKEDGAKSYQDWLDQQKSSLVRDLNVL